MKKLIYSLVALLVLSVTSVSAQQKGDVYVGGDLGFGVSSVIISGESVTGVEFGIQPSVGIFLADRLLLGFGLGYNVSGGDGATHTLTLGPRVGYYVPLCKNLYYTPTLDLQFCYVASEGYGVPGFGLGVNLFGVEYRPTERIGLSANLLSLDYVLLSKEGLTVNTVDFGLSLSPRVGAKFYF
ncbi:MAG: outer membrane beta-barrel protein [Alistipes sp.]|nr:outer membrane beta-barrel protein [Alistipes sp.]